LRIGNRVSELLGVEYPIFQGGMAWVATANLAAAVSNAGGLGIIAAGNLNPEKLSSEIDKLRSLTDKPFGVNLMLLSPQIEELFDVVVEKKVPVVSTGAGNPAKYMESFKKIGTIVIPVVASATQAIRMEKIGADAVVAEGMEAGGHIGKLTTMVLIPEVVDNVSIPVIAAGGIADGRGVAAAFCLGAEGVQLGTRFICSPESEAHENFKIKLLKSRSLDAIVTGNSTGHPVRSLRNTLTKEIIFLEKKGAGFEEIETVALGGLRKAVIEGDMKMGSVMAGQSVGLVKKILPVEEIIREVFEDAGNTIKKLEEGEIDE